MPNDRPDNADVVFVLREIDGKLARQEQLLNQCHDAITGGARVADGLAYRTAKLEHDASEERESRTFWTRAIGGTALGALITALWGIIFKGGSAHP